MNQSNEDQIEKVAEKVHDAWMKEKLDQGYHAPIDCPQKQFAIELNAGVFRKFEKLCSKCHTDLYPYNELPENIKEYDRVTVRAVLNALEEMQK